MPIPAYQGPAMADYTLVAPQKELDEDQERPVKHKETIMLQFIRLNVSIVVVMLTGLAISGLCFWYTYWLSTHKFECPEWTVGCLISPQIAFLVANLGQVQGLVSTLFGIGVSMIALAAYKLAETTLWPALAQKAFLLAEIDDYLSTVHGSLPCIPKALWRARGIGPIAVLATVSLVSITQLAAHVVVGHAFNQVNVTTEYSSVHVVR